MHLVSFSSSVAVADATASGRAATVGDTGWFWAWQQMPAAAVGLGTAEEDAGSWAWWLVKHRESSSLLFCTSQSQSEIRPMHALEFSSIHKTPKMYLPDICTIAPPTHTHTHLRPWQCINYAGCSPLFYWSSYAKKIGKKKQASVLLKSLGL